MKAVSEKTVQKAIRKLGEDPTFKDTPKTGRKKGPGNPYFNKRTLKLFTQGKEVSVRNMVKKMVL